MGPDNRLASRGGELAPAGMQESCYCNVTNVVTDEMRNRLRDGGLLLSCIRPSLGRSCRVNPNLAPGEKWRQFLRVRLTLGGFLLLHAIGSDVSVSLSVPCPGSRTACSTCRRDVEHGLFVVCKFCDGASKL